MVVAVAVVAVVAVVVTHGAAMAIGAAFGLEGFAQDAQQGTLSGQHVLDHMIAPDQQARGFDLAWRMTVADMPGKPRQVAGHFGQLFLGGHDLNPGAVGQFEPPVVVEIDEGGQIDQKGGALHRGQATAADQPGVIIEHHKVMRL